MPQRKSITSRRWLYAALVSFSLMLLAFPALAGRVQIRDSGGLFTSADTSALHSEGGDYPFDVRIVATSEYDKKSDFDHYVRAQVNEPNVVVVGVDREHRFTSVHFGTGLGVAPSQFKAIEQAGSPHFKEGNWRAGVEAILNETRQAAHPQTGSSQAAGPTQPNGAEARRSTAGSTVFFGLVVVLVVGGLIAFVGSMLSRRARAGELPPPNYGPGPYPPGGPGYGPGPGYYGPGYGPGYGGRSGIGTGIAGAALGGLAGYELGKMAGEREGHPHHDDQSSAGVVGGDDRDNYDAGGSTGGWDDDSGGGGGDWGGGDSGGGDWGGGGDSGGGGSDW